jgi:inhibitor of KinA sporulation pathway (predicted exonuclease)
MNYIVFDLEWNVAGKANRVDRMIQEAIPFEIIEIGAVKLDDRFQQVSKFSVQIRPKVYPILSGQVAAVTRRYQQSLRYGLSFPEASRDFFSWCGSDYLFCTWSESDTDVLKKNLKYYQAADILSAGCLDVQQLFDLLVEQADMQRSIEYAVDFLQLPKDKPFHQAVHDAGYTGQILRATASILAREKPGLNWIEKLTFDPNLNRSCLFDLNNLAGGEDAREKMLASQFHCPACGTELARQQDWLMEGNKILARFHCPEHGQISGKCRLKKNNDAMWSAYITIRLEHDLED